ncbi:NO-inducible flavohemoprotein [Aquimarina sp. TRL1]|uniref:NO-inducible flavohemoprotein n=1 Tax=Aquimarina sp. (strain TRL1) TaxID=2736252 RepID=UPI00158952F0|nr:NO-inducible flavohemoprotein [Aquimarina sp. TRL1]QKX06425.1 NO-inducible flavohemoprotein [Aquimarina sp. TRL1]
MASTKTIEIVKATAPVLEVHGETITKVFYKRLFNQHPELKNIFNMSHQKQGTQPKVLANAIFQYARHIDQLDLLKGAVESIAQKHSSLSIRPEMYPIVGENLLVAIKEVLGDAATPEIMNAWEEAYGDLAAIFINREEQLYNEKEKSLHGFRGQKEFIVFKKVAESNVITSFYLKRIDGTPVPSFIPGQYVGITLEIPGTSHKHTRNYSLSDAPQKDYLRISVKKEKGDPDGIVSNYLHNNIETGDTLSVGMPSGEFVVRDSNAPVVLLAGGVGITPLLSMYKALVKNPHRRVIFIQCVLHSGTHAFKQEIATLAHPDVSSVHIYSAPLTTDTLGETHDFEGFLSKEILKTVGITAESDFYCCGPAPFMANALHLLDELEIPTSQIHYEFFGPAEELELV